MTNAPAPPPGLSPRHLFLYVVRPTVATLMGPDVPGMASDAAVELLMGTIAQESGFRALDQITSAADRTIGPAYGLYQIEPATLDDLYDNFLRFRPSLAARLAGLAASWPSTTMQLVTNLSYATAVARLLYYRSPVRLANPGDIEGHARVWKQVYNTPKGKGRPEDFVANYRRLVAPYL
ncbi:hypothetical protein A6A40_17240 (plasmid) [Azospirillum humicireducens]|uniref:Transglycosylase SLT domain-containing protein n=1 Tax=Azospirillum humicireducens TaxID=1226968 RepID=A0A2R4VQT0_9PROT|nr:hypothetical protein [Azospirillum humicireducens]AWB06799.1 hypothetical protein A6A40_17240 [Azospirillum humicireducens]